MFDRRQFLATAGVATAGLGLLPGRRARAAGEDSKVGIAILRHGTGFDRRPNAVEQLMWETSKRTSIDVREAPVLVDAEHDELFRHPLIAWIGAGPSEPLPSAAVEHLGRYLRAGGTLFIDDASPPGDDRFDGCVRREVARLLPGNPLVPVGNDHTIYRTFFLLQRPFGRIDRADDLEGVQFDDRSPVLYGRNDLFGAFGRDRLGNWLMPVVPGGAGQREMAFRVGINLVMYATCLNYKRDQVHTTAILRRRRWRVDPPARENR